MSEPILFVVVVVVIDVVSVKKNFRSKNILVQKNSYPKKLWAKIFGSKRVMSKKSCGPKKKFGSKKFWIQFLVKFK